LRYFPGQTGEPRRGERPEQWLWPPHTPTTTLTNGSTIANGKPNGLHRRIPSDVTSASESDADFENAECVITNRFLDNLFHFGAELGNELFYITFYPFWLWNVDGWVGRRICVFWGIFMYFGQAMKDVIRWPRPPSPPVFKLEKRYALEYGFPSTHAMVGAGMPFGILILTMQRYIVSKIRS
jgi:sphingosine-1-phosphate phosphatase 1